ncbi:MAG: DUF4914 family protein [Firmicutes bacterium]|nr:DUF4914 family protein [Bacillota bacterium]
MANLLKKFSFTNDIADVLANCKSVTIPRTKDELVSLAFGGTGANSFDVVYDVKGKPFKEATIVRCKNGAAVNYCEDYMRRRDPDCMAIADDLPTDKPRFKDLYGKDFSSLRKQTYEWLKGQDLLVMPVMSGGTTYGSETVLIAPKNAAFFACGFADLQFLVNISEYKGTFKPKVVLFLAPPFRHTFFSKKQMVVHNRLPELYEMFSYNLYPGPSAKKGIYGFLLHEGEREGWITAHASAVKVITPYENEIVIMHEGASGGGKSEMGENIHKEPNGKILIGQNVETKEKFHMLLDEPCELQPVADDMALCHPKMQNESQKLVIQDAENGWFLRLDHIKHYGTEPVREKLTIHPPEPLVFINIQGAPDATCLIWEHTIDSNGQPCPNPRVVMPRSLMPGIVSGPVEVDLRSFGVRTPPCTAKRPTYGILGMIQVVPPALAWLWRLVAPRGHNNPSIVETEGMTSEGIGSYGPFLTGKRVAHANILLKQIIDSPATRYMVIPNQHIGCIKVGFMPQWIAREYVARRGSAKFKAEQLVPARCALLGYCLESLKVDGQYIGKSFLQPETQKEVGAEAYDLGAKMLSDFFKKQLADFDTPELDPLGKKIIDLCMNDATLEEYLELIPMRL